VIEGIAKVAQPFLDSNYVRRTRRNHGLEHATVHMLTALTRGQPRSMAGRSDAGGFWLFGDLEPSLVEQAAHEALHRLQNGEHHLAIHPNCGTGLLTTGTLAGLAALIGSVGVRRGASDYLLRLPTVILLSMGAIVLSQPIGLDLQRHFTTLGDPGDLRILDIKRDETRGPLGGKMTVHRISTESS
jgi:hypothetical protein